MPLDAALPYVLTHMLQSAAYTHMGTSWPSLPGSWKILPAAAFIRRCMRWGESSTNLGCRLQQHTTDRSVTDVQVTYTGTSKHRRLPLLTIADLRSYHRQA
jgi:hypothetical protein